MISNRIYNLGEEKAACEVAQGLPAFVAAVGLPQERRDKLRHNLPVLMGQSGWAVNVSAAGNLQCECSTGRHVLLYCDTGGPGGDIECCADCMGDQQALHHKMAAIGAAEAACTCPCECGDGCTCASRGYHGFCMCAGGCGCRVRASDHTCAMRGVLANLEQQCGGEEAIFEAAPAWAAAARAMLDAAWD